MAITLTPQNRNTLTLTEVSRAVSPTWDERTNTWDEAIDSWDHPGMILTLDTRNNLAYELWSAASFPWQEATPWDTGGFNLEPRT